MNASFFNSRAFERAQRDHRETGNAAAAIETMMRLALTANDGVRAWAATWLREQCHVAVASAPPATLDIHHAASTEASRLR